MRTLSAALAIHDVVAIAQALALRAKRAVYTGRAALAGVGPRIVPSRTKVALFELP